METIREAKNQAETETMGVETSRPATNWISGEKMSLN
jgi:hypothetical protein